MNKKSIILDWIYFWKQSKKSVGRKCNRRSKYMKFAKKARNEGVAFSRIDRIAKEYTLDYFEGGGKESPEKWYLYDYGIATYKAKWYGITKENCNRFLSDYDFYNLENYLNKKFVFWFDHKLSTYYILHPFIDSMPIHHYYVKQGAYLPIDRRFIKEGYRHKSEDVIELIKTRPLIAKACKGGHGEGLYKLVYENGEFQVNNQPADVSEVRKVLGSLDDYIITDFIAPHDDLVRIVGEDNYAVVRLTIFYDQQDGPQLTSARVRLGCNQAGFRTDYDGTIYSGLTFKEGRTFGSWIRRGEFQYDEIHKHPDTGVDLDGIVIPNWDKLMELISDISKYIPMTPQLDIDVIPTNESFSVLEINSHGQFIECHYPFRDNKYNLKQYKTKDRAIR
ncbi:MAG: hypothetical protein AUK63_22 [bacterium P3]|nr:MAG: hypothetical protein AUK63_22 [bacterium P3]KWW42513.1 MAG: hypothetical protein F083_417 [bacterium F083]